MHKTTPKKKRRSASMMTGRDPDGMRASRLFGHLRWNISLSGFQTAVGIVTGLVSVGGAILAVPSLFSSPPPPTKGQLVAIIEEAKTAKAITDARVEILTPQNVLVTTVTPNYFGKARHELEEGPYRVRVTHPKYGSDVRQIVVVKGETVELHVRLKGGAGTPFADAERVVKDTVGSIKRIFKDE
jgi:hypothetical protein